MIWQTEDICWVYLYVPYLLDQRVYSLRKWYQHNKKSEYCANTAYRTFSHSHEDVTVWSRDADTQNVISTPVTMVNNRLSVTLQNDYRLDRLIELIKFNDKLSIPINQDNCIAVESWEKKCIRDCKLLIDNATMWSTVYFSLHVVEQGSLAHTSWATCT